MADANKLPALTANGRRLIETMAGLPRGWLTAAALAEAIGVSRRTVLRELPGVEQWMQAAGFRFLRSPGQGILLDEEDRSALLRLLGKGEAAALPREERRERLLTALLAADEPVKTYALASDLAISEHTLAADLTWVEEWLAPHGVILYRRPGVGVWVEGAPAQRRRAVGALLRQRLPETDTRAKPALAGLLDREISAKVWPLLRDFETEEGLTFTDAGFLALAIHCTLTVQQLSNGCWGQGEIAKLVRTDLAARLADRLGRAFSLTLPLEEVRYLALYLNAHGGQNDPEDWGSADELELRNLAATLILEVEEALGVDLGDYPSLAVDLCCHLRPMLYRMEQGVPVDNPQLDAIREQYAPLWRATREACDRASETLGLGYISDEEAGFLAMHFGAILEKESLARMRVHAVVVCPFGMASSKFLTSQLLREFAVLHITASGSARTLNAEELRAQGVDLVISTVPLTLDFPTVCVNSILQEQDRARLRAAIERVQSEGIAPSHRQRPQAQEDLRYAGRLSAALLDLLANIRIQIVSVPKTRAALITAGSRLFCARQEDRQMVEKGLLRRETLGDTYVKPLRAVLLHCRTGAVAGCRLGYLRADPPVYEQGKLMQGALVLLAPDGADELPVEVMQAVSGLLIEDHRLIEALRAGDEGRTADVLEEGLSKHFQNALKSRWNG